MMYHYTYEYGWFNVNETVHVFRSKDGLIGLRVHNHRGKGTWVDGYSRFFVWADEDIDAEFDSELQARAFLGARDQGERSGSVRQPSKETNLA